MLKTLNNSLYYVMNRVVYILDNMVGGFFVQGAALIEQALQDGFGRFVRVQQGAVFVAAGALDQGTKIAFQIENRAAVFQMRPVFRVEYGAATGGENNVLPAGQFVDNGFFTPAETFFAFFLEDKRYIRTGALLDDPVTVVKIHFQPARKLAPDRGFAGAHKADEENIVFAHGSFSAMLRLNPSAAMLTDGAMIIRQTTHGAGDLYKGA